MITSGRHQIFSDTFQKVLFLLCVLLNHYYIPPQKQMHLITNTLGSFKVEAATYINILIVVQHEEMRLFLLKSNIQCCLNLASDYPSNGVGG